mmetsp:Transcript_23229/g.58891  ORF Transcript_23229/g.58891 Transcript_23229/m.58891 type:complete len:108 (+) Transcript_23229:923-1246(+)
MSSRLTPSLSPSWYNLSKILVKSLSDTPCSMSVMADSIYVRLPFYAAPPLPSVSLKHAFRERDGDGVVLAAGGVPNSQENCLTRVTQQVLSQGEEGGEVDAADSRSF